MGRVAAVGRAGVAESALSDAVKVVKEVEARCASAQARDPEARQQALARERDLARELEEANNNGLKVCVYVCVWQWCNRSRYVSA